LVWFVQVVPWTLQPKSLLPSPTSHLPPPTTNLTSYFTVSPVPFLRFLFSRSLPTVRFRPFASCSVPTAPFPPLASYRSVPAVRFLPFASYRSVPAVRFLPLASCRLLPAVRPASLNFSHGVATLSSAVCSVLHDAGSSLCHKSATSADVSSVAKLTYCCFDHLTCRGLLRHGSAWHRAG
jgi:hypothetical protein